jgi:hypothetical protein
MSEEIDCGYHYEAAKRLLKEAETCSPDLVERKITLAHEHMEIYKELTKPEPVSNNWTYTTPTYMNPPWTVTSGNEGSGLTSMGDTYP